MKLKTALLGLLASIICLAIFCGYAINYFDTEDVQQLRYGNLDNYLSDGLFYGLAWIPLSIPVIIFLHAILEGVFIGSQNKKQEKPH
jgi:hypothetical protein